MLNKIFETKCKLKNITEKFKYKCKAKFQNFENGKIYVSSDQKNLLMNGVGIGGMLRTILIVCY